MARKATPVGADKVDEGAEHRARLVVLRDLLESRLMDAAHRDTAPLAARYQSVLTELASLPAPAKGSTLDDLAARRVARRTVTSDSQRTPVRDNSG